ncbi:hypothetical protein ABLE94_24125 [Gordonia sp. VNK1]|uniref:hypothetical protein n=1 Tax=Gordonia oleivorans TaxID=3156618 RepID=UPI0032B55387
MSAARIGHAVYDEMLLSGHMTNVHTTGAVDKSATGKVSTTLGVSVPQATAWMTLSFLLSTLPTVTAAFLDGDHSLERIRIIADEIASCPTTMCVRSPKPVRCNWPNVIRLIRHCGIRSSRW